MTRIVQTLINLQSSIFLFFFLIAISFSTSFAQKTHLHPYDKVGCELPATHGDKMISKPYIFQNQNQNRALAFTINFLPTGTSLNGNTCITWPINAQVAFTYAASIWSDALQSTQNIGINACWTEDLGANTLGSAGPTNFLTIPDLPNNFPQSFFPVALAEHLMGSQQAAIDINTSINANRDDWYFGIDASPALTEFDFVSVALHELGHGLGFLGASSVDNGVGPDECDGVNGNGCIGFLIEGNYIPTIYDQFVDIDDGTSILNLANPSLDIATVLTGGSTTDSGGGLNFDDTNINYFRNAANIKLYTPETYQSGSSYSHFDEGTLEGELMSPSISSGQAIHDPGMATLVMLEMGWSEAVALPVTLTTFEGKNLENTNLLKWETASEFNNDYFSVEKSRDGKKFSSIGIIRGNGTTNDLTQYSFVDYRPFDGKNYYRLKQFDLDKGFAYSEIIVINYDKDSGEIALFPNPAFDKVNLFFGHIPSDNSIVSIHSIDGRTMQVMDFQEIENQQLSIDISEYPKGSYFIRILEGTQLFTKKFVKTR